MTCNFGEGIYFDLCSIRFNPNPHPRMNPYLAEIIGTALLILLGNGAVATFVLKGSKGQVGGWVAINPARDLGPRIAHALLPIAGKGSSDWAYAWVPIVTLLLGGIAGAQLFNFLNF